MQYYVSVGLYEEGVLSVKRHDILNCIISAPKNDKYVRKSQSSPREKFYMLFLIIKIACTTGQYGNAAAIW